MKDYANIFKAYDIRGRVGPELDTEVVKKIGKALADWLPSEGAVAVGRDMRPDSAELAEALIEGIISQGRNVWDIGEVTSDMIYFATGHYGLAGGAMITASHNPGDYNGIKLCHEQAKPIGEDTGLAKIKEAVLKDSFKKVSKKGLVEQKDVLEAWVSHALSFINVDDLRPIKLVVDAGNGMAGKIIPELEPYVPFDVTEMYFALDGTFPNHIANPLEPKNLEDLIEKVRQVKADVGLAFDGDGDRAVLVDEKGESLTGTVMTAILAEYFLSKHPGGKVLHNAITGQAARDSIESAGGTAVRTKVGHSNIKNDMRTHGGIFAGEHSGHYYFADNYMADSGLIAALVALAVLCRSNMPLSKLADQYRTYQSIPETNFEVSDKELVMNQVAKAFSEAEVDWLDGVTLGFSDGWINVRPSNTEPLLRLNAEFKSSKKLEEYAQRTKAIIEKYSSNS